MIKKPLVLNSNGQMEQLQPSDSIAIGLKSVEIDFGVVPVTSKSFIIPDVDVTAINIVLAFANPNPGTGRVGNDWEWDMPFFSAVSDVNFFTLSVVLTHAVVGPRKIYYSIT